MADLSIKITEGTLPVVVAVGEIDLSTAPEFERAITLLMGEGSHSVAVDLSRVSYLDSTGISVLMRALKRCRARGGEVKIVGISDRALRVLKLLSLDEVICARPEGAPLAA